MKIGIIQQHNTPDVADNKARLREKIDKLAADGANLIVLQELHNTIYFCQTENVDKFDLGETIPGPSTDFYGAAARDNGIVLVASLFEKAVPPVCTTTQP